MPIVDRSHEQRQLSGSNHDQRTRHHFRRDGDSVLPELTQTLPPALLSFVPHTWLQWHWHEEYEPMCSLIHLVC